MADSDEIYALMERVSDKRGLAEIVIELEQALREEKALREQLMLAVEEDVREQEQLEKRNVIWREIVEDYDRRMATRRWRFLLWLANVNMKSQPPSELEKVK